MPRIIVMADRPTDIVMLSERISVADLASEHFRAQLLLAWFWDEEACVDYLEWLRWPDGFRCRRCVSRLGWRLSTGRSERSVCGQRSSVTAGTMFDRTRTPLRMWFAAAWMMTSQKHGASALGVQRALGLGT